MQTVAFKAPTLRQIGLAMKCELPLNQTQEIDDTRLA